MTVYDFIAPGKHAAKTLPASTTGTLKEYIFDDPLASLLEAPPPPPMPTIETVPIHGGYQLTISEIIVAGSYKVHIGPLGTAADPQAIAGVVGAQDDVVFVDQGGGIASATVWIPNLPIGSGYFVFLEGVGIADILLDQPLITVIPRVFRSGTLSLRQTLPPHYKTGPKTAAQVRFPQK